MRVLLALLPLVLVAAAPVPQRPVRVAITADDGVFADRGAVSADAVNANCLGCHSAGMVLTQPRLTPVQWGETITKMRAVYKAPIEPVDDAPIIAWLTAP
ncbi:cytochrome C nitrite reductase [Sandarakinorhabdus sp.]|uniref:cytochrome C nitrite reductase n=1 Tax=Sandarakinorhabdus sp. TaxID=1916663 RepID=UPI00286DA178|nr:cytochrome C nitrite reductase [Sandarakinorhabdus sp.]